MELSNFYLQLYCKNNNEHKDTIKKLVNDDESLKYLSDLSILMDSLNVNSDRLNWLYIVYRYSKPVGVMILSLINGKYFVSYGILRGYRGVNLGSLLLMEFSDKILRDDNGVDCLYLSINDSNIASVKAASNALYVKEKYMKYKKSRL